MRSQDIMRWVGALLTICVKLFSGASGYGLFSMTDFTDQRIVVIHPANPPPYMLIG